MVSDKTGLLGFCYTTPLARTAWQAFRSYPLAFRHD